MTMTTSVPMKRLLLILPVLLLLVLSAATAEEVTVEIPATMENFTLEEDTSADLAAGYINKWMYPTTSTGKKGIRRVQQAIGSRLTGAELAMYQEMAEQVPLIAAGERTSTVFMFDAEDIYEQVTYTKEELGVETIISPMALSRMRPGRRCRRSAPDSVGSNI